MVMSGDFRKIIRIVFALLNENCVNFELFLSTQLEISAVLFTRKGIR